MTGYNSISNDIDEYISNYPENVQTILKLLRITIRNVAPTATETISYQMPTFTLHGNLVHFAAYKNHIGFYPSSSGIEAFKRELTAFKCSKGTIQFPIEKPLPLDIISKIVAFRVEENIKKAAKKTKK
jgi:uncharacterized protein YdhG (YjbR/CyaY superfamily)